MNTSIKILCFDQFFSDLAKQNEFKCLSEQDAGDYRNVDGIVVRLGVTLTANYLREFPDLKFVASITTGLDHIDTNYCVSSNIRIFSLKGETKFLSHIHATPEMTWTLLLALFRNLVPAVLSTRKGEWRRELFFGNELHGKTLGILGFGRVGKIVGRYAVAFGMNVCAYDLCQTPFNDYPMTYVTLEQLLQDSDVVSIHLPQNRNTHHFLADREFSLMKKTAVLVNTSRGSIVKEKSLLDSLINGVISGASIDVIEGETDPNYIDRNHDVIEYARKNDNLLVTPHIAGSTYNSMTSTAQFILEKIRRSYEAGY